MKNTLLLAAVIAVGGIAQAGADHSLLPPRAQEQFPRMGGHEGKIATGPGGTVTHTYAGAANKFQAHRSGTVMGARTAEADLISRPVYTGRWPFKTVGQQRFEVAPLKQSGKQCDANCTKACCKK